MAKKEVRISALGTLVREVKDNDIMPIVADNKTYHVSVRELLRSINAKLATKEDDLGTPLANGYVLSSDITGSRSWIPQGTGGGTSTGLEAIDEGNGSGWRLIGETTTGRLALGTHAIDMTTRDESLGYYTVPGVGSSGVYSLSTNANNIASGRYSLSTGVYNESIGDYSATFSGGLLDDGFGDTPAPNKAGGKSSFVAGINNRAGTFSSINAVPYNTDTYSGGGDYATAFGVSNAAVGTGSFAAGWRGSATGNYSVVLGYNLVATQNGQAVLGVYNNNKTDTILEVGNGVSSGATSNAFEVYLDGRVIAPGLNTITDPKSLTTKEYVDANSGGGGAGTGLERITEYSGYYSTTGWRLVGRDPVNYGPIGTEAVDLSESTSPSSTRGATGYNSLAAGLNTIASGTASVATGSTNSASGNYSTAKGIYTIASGPASFAAGSGYSTNYSLEARNRGSVIMGVNTFYNSVYSSGRGSVLMGYFGSSGAYSSGSGSISLGFSTKASNTGQVALGRENINRPDTILEVGIGGSRNAFEVYLDGTATLPEATAVEIDARGAKAIIIKEYLLSAEFGNSLPTIDPVVAGRLWNNNGVVSVSTGI